MCQAQSDVEEALASLATARRPTTVLFTTASMIAVIKRVVAATGVTLLLSKWFPTLLAVISGAVVGVVFVAIFLRYQNKRYNSLSVAPTR